VLVIGDAMLDSYLEGTASGLCREAPVPVVALAAREDVPGGAANTAANLRALGAQVSLLAVTGADAEAELLGRALEARGVATEHLLARPDRRTLAKQRVVAAGQVLVRFDQGSTTPLDAAAERALLERLDRLFPTSDAVVISDYCYGVLTPRVIRALARWQAAAPRVLVADSRRLTAYRTNGLTVVKPNYHETIELLGDRSAPENGARADWLGARGARLLDITGAQIAAITLDSDGALVVERGSAPYRTYARRVANAQPAGAGDTFLSAFTLALAAGADTPSAAELASAAAGIVVARPGTATCGAEELRAAISADGKYARDLGRLLARLDMYRQEGKRIVFTNGCFDILHRGHVTYLSRAKALGDVLVVGVNGDAGVRRLKGPTRPINTLEDRAQVLAALSCVDHLVAFDEDTPVQIIRAIRPDVFVKGGDYTREKLPEAPVVESLGGTVHILPYLQDRSTTGIIERIKAAGAPLERAVGESFG
jgi:D-beta-D-heptose 7-phosphate kinase/D-beta-D-heptose 1-phosphate adenosyltransferase